MKHMPLTRRALLVRACQVPAVTLAVLAAGCGNKQRTVACADLAQSSDSDQGLRSSLQYTDDAPDPARTCRRCAYFHSDAKTPECGQCVILSGAVAMTGHCTSWTEKK